MYGECVGVGCNTSIKCTPTVLYNNSDYDYYFMFIYLILFIFYLFYYFYYYLLMLSILPPFLLAVVIIRARDELTSELRAPRDKNASRPNTAMPTSNAFKDCAVFSDCNDFEPCNESTAAPDQEGGCSLGGDSESIGEDGEYCLSTSDLQWGRSFVNQQSMRSQESHQDESLEETEEEEKSCEVEEEDEEEASELSVERCVCVCVVVFCLFVFFLHSSH